MHQTPEKIANVEPPRQGQPTSDALRILLVMDNLDDALLLRRTIDQAEHTRAEVQHATSLSDALDCLYRERFGAILLDMDLPDSSGVDAIEALHAAVPHLPIIPLVEADDDALAMRVLRAGAQDTILKGQLTAGSLE